VLLTIKGIIDNAFRPKQTLKKSRIQLYTTLAFPILLYGCENWTNKARDATRIASAEMKYMRITAGYAWPSFGQNKLDTC
jgi:hypothetical protein